MSNKLFIPNKIKVGFQKREDTYTKKLAYVVYYDMTGKLRKETSWNSWRDKKIDPIEFDNVPTEGFVLNKKVGGHRSHWNARQTYVRVYDPRDFEFEISVPNLLYILRDCDCSKGKGLEGKFVYSWDGTELVLLPEGSPDYQECKNYTSLQTVNVKAKDLKLGATYLTKQQEKLIYVGRFACYYQPCRYSYKKKDRGGIFKQYVFVDKRGDFQFLDGLKSLAVIVSESPVDNYAELVDKFNKSKYGSPIVELYMKPDRKPDDPNVYTYRSNPWFVEAMPGRFLECETYYKYSHTIPIEIDHIQVSTQFSLNNGFLKREGIGYYSTYGSTLQPTNNRLYARLSSGSEYLVGGYDGLYTSNI